jgi:HlyD family secretion protein
MAFSHGKGKKNDIFRQDALERLSSPERLDQLMQVIKPADWIALVGLGGIIGCGVLWSIFGRIPVTVQGRGVFTQPRQVIDLQSTIAGQLQTLNISNGACVKKGDVLATIAPTELAKQLQLSKSKLAELRVQAGSSLGLAGQRIQTERSAIDASRNGLQQRLQSTIAFSPTLQTKGIDAIDQQRRSLQQRLQDAQALVPVMQQRLETRKNLLAQGAIPQEALLQVEREYIQARQSVADAEAQIKQLDVQETQTEQQYLNNLQSATDVRAQLQELDTRAKRLEQETLDTSNQWAAQITATEREIAQLTQQYTTNSRIVSAHDGCIVELTATVGQVVQPGLRLASVQIPQGAGDGLSGVTYFAVKDGKRIQPGMKVMITPDTIQRERFGGVVGTVANVSALPVTMEGAISVVGNPEVVKTLVDPSGAMIEVNAKLTADAKTPSGFQWSSSQGPTAKITPGTTATALITLEERAPITFILPFLKEMTGV